MRNGILKRCLVFAVLTVFGGLLTGCTVNYAEHEYYIIQKSVDGWYMDFKLPYEKEFGDDRYQYVYDSLEQMRDAIIGGELTKAEVDYIMDVYSVNGGRVKICQMDKLYEPGVPEGWTKNTYSWRVEQYIVGISNGDGQTALITVYNTDQYVSAFNDSIIAKIEGEVITQLQDKNGEESIISDGTAKRVKRYVDTEDISYTVVEFYRLTNGECEEDPYISKIYASADDVHFTVDFAEGSKPLDEETVRSFTLEKIR